MDSYVEAWQTFRSLSNENAVTAEHLVAQPGWPKAPGSAVADIGCGDGHLLSEILKRSAGQISTAWLIDPSARFLKEAEIQLSTENPAVEVFPLLGFGEVILPEVVERADVFLAVHVVYLMKAGALETILELLPPRKPLYLVLDDQESIFATLWRKTRPDYYERTQTVHRTIADLPEGSFQAKRTTIRSELHDPEAIADRHIRSAVLSLLCYRQMIEDDDRDLYDWVLMELRKRSRSGHIPCESACYEILRS